jgi:hypothetical protein
MTNKTMKTHASLLALLLAASLPASAAMYHYDSGAITQGIPDNNLLGTGDALTYTLGGAQPVITDVSLSFSLLGGYSGDLSGYLRLGQTPSSPFYDLTSLIQGQTLGGTPVAYTIDFTTGGFETAFDGRNPNNTWTLFLADSAAGDATTVTGWSLDITAVPEPTTWAAMIFGGGLAGVHLLRSPSARRTMGRWRGAAEQWLDAA